VASGKVGLFGLLECSFNPLIDEWENVSFTGISLNAKVSTMDVCVCITVRKSVLFFRIFFIGILKFCKYRIISFGNTLGIDAYHVSC
jgi:hypothetical protein